MGMLPIESGTQLLGSRRAQVADAVKLRRPTMTVRVNPEVVYSRINRAKTLVGSGSREVAGRSPASPSSLRNRVSRTSLQLRSRRPLLKTQGNLRCRPGPAPIHFFTRNYQRIALRPVHTFRLG